MTHPRSVAAFEVETHYGLATVTFTGEAPNHMSTTTARALQQLLSRIAVRSDVYVLLLQSRVPGFFVPHFDVTEILDFPSNSNAGTTITPFHAMCELLRTMPKVTIAMIEGRCGGGGNEIAMSCDMRFASRDATFNQPEVALGIIPGGSGTVRLTRLVGRARALELKDATRLTRVGLGHPEGFLEAFANFYRDVADELRARRDGLPTTIGDLSFPTGRDGLIGVRFVEAVTASHHADSAWTPVGTTPQRGH